MRALAKYKPEVFDRLYENTRFEGECEVWKGELNALGYPVIQSSYGQLIRQDILVFSHLALGRATSSNDELIHTCDRLDCLNLEHMRLMTDAEKIERQLDNEARAIKQVQAGVELKYAASECGIPWRRLRVLCKIGSIEPKKEARNGQDAAGDGHRSGTLAGPEVDRGSAGRSAPHHGSIADLPSSGPVGRHSDGSLGSARVEHVSKPVHELSTLVDVDPCEPLQDLANRYGIDLFEADKIRNHNRHKEVA